MNKLSPTTIAIVQGVAVAHGPAWAMAYIKRRAAFEQLINKIQCVTNATIQDTVRLHKLLLPELHADWVEHPGEWAYHLACEGVTIDRLIEIAESEKS